METMQIPMTGGLKIFLETQAAKNGFPSSCDFVQSVLSDLQRHEEERKELDRLLLEGVRSPVVEGDRAFWEERRRKILDKHPELKSCDPSTTQ